MAAAVSAAVGAAPVHSFGAAIGAAVITAVEAVARAVFVNAVGVLFSAAVGVADQIVPIAPSIYAEVFAAAARTAVVISPVIAV